MINSYNLFASDTCARTRSKVTSRRHESSIYQGLKQDRVRGEANRAIEDRWKVIFFVDILLLRPFVSRVSTKVEKYAMIWRRELRYSEEKINVIYFSGASRR